MTAMIWGIALRRSFGTKGLYRSLSGSNRYAETNKFPYITATHDVNNPRSGKVMQAIGMKYQYSYEEYWQPKLYLVTFRMYN